MFDQEVVSTRTFSLAPDMGASWQIAIPIQIRWGGADDSTQPPPTVSSTDDTDPTASSATNGVDNPGESSPEGNGSDGRGSSSLSTGGIVGIAIGLFAFGLLCAGLGFFLFRRHRKQQPPAGSHGQPNLPHPHQSMAAGPGYWKGPGYNTGPPEMAATGWSGVNQGHNSWNNPPGELDQRNYSAPPLTELEGGRNRGAELGDQNYR